MSMGDGRRSARQRRTTVLVVLVAVLLGAALFATIASLNRDVYSASGFVRQYLDALARQDTASALALPGVRPTNRKPLSGPAGNGLPSTLLRASALGTLTDIRLIADTETAPDRRRVVYGFELDGTKSTMEFAVERSGTFAVVFDNWRFSTSPIAVLDVTVRNEATFTVNRLTLDARAHAAPGAPATFTNRAKYLAFAPALYSFSHSSTLLASPPQKVAVTSTGATKVTVDAEPNTTFTGQVQKSLNAFLDACSGQKVLQPSNCPYGIEINDRVQGVPSWSIAQYPVVTLTAGTTTFEMPATAGQARIVVGVQSLFDGRVETRDENVPFTVALSVTVKPDGGLAIALR